MLAGWAVTCYRPAAYDDVTALHALPFLSVPVATAISGESSRAFLQRVNQLLERAADLLMPWLFLLLGLALLADSVAFFMTGEGLIEFGT